MVEFEDEFGVDPGFRKIGFLSVVPESKREIALQMASIRQRCGVNTLILSPADLGKEYPWVNVNDIIVGVLGPDDGTLDIWSILRGFASAARRLGVSIEEGTRAVGIQTQSGGVSAVLTEQGSVATKFVVNAAGADAATVGSWLGLKLRLRTAAAKRLKNVTNATTLIWNVLRVAESRWRQLDAPELLKDVSEGRKFVDGRPITRSLERSAA